MTLEEMLQVLACPRCQDRPSLVLNGGMLVCGVCGSRYPVINGIPRLIADAEKTAKEIHEESDEPGSVESAGTAWSEPEHDGVSGA